MTGGPDPPEDIWLNQPRLALVWRPGRVWWGQQDLPFGGLASAPPLGPVLVPSPKLGPGSLACCPALTPSDLPWFGRLAAALLAIARPL